MGAKLLGTLMVVFLIGLATCSDLVKPEVVSDEPIPNPATPTGTRHVISHRNSRIDAKIDELQQQVEDLQDQIKAKR